MRCSPRHMKRRTAEAVLDLVGNGSDVEVLERPGPCLLGRSAVVPVAGPQTAHGSRLLYPCDVCDVDPEHQAAGSPAAAGGALAGGRSVRARGTFGLARAKCERSNSAAKRTMARAARFGIPSRRFQMALLLLVLTSRPFVTGCCAALHLRNWQAGLRFAQASQQAASGPTSRSESIRVAHRHGHGSVLRLLPGLRRRGQQVLDMAFPRAGFSRLRKPRAAAQSSTSFDAAAHPGSRRGLLGPDRFEAFA